MPSRKSKKAPPPPPEPVKTVQEMTKEAKKGLDGMLREFRREIFRIEMDAKKIKKDLERMVKKGESKSSQRLLAQNYLKKQEMMKKYKGLEAKLEGVKISLANISSTQALVDTMNTMGTILNKTGKMVDVNSVQRTIMEFNTAYEKQNLVSEMVGDAMDVGEDEVHDADADQLIDQLNANKKAPQQKEQQDNDFMNKLEDLKK